MANPHSPPQIDAMGGRPFSFYPPIVAVEHNEWLYQEGRWSEVLVKNSKTGDEVWIPRTYLGDISKIEEPVMIVGLKRELEFKGGAVWPHSRRVITMPASPTMPRPQAGPEEPEAPMPSALSQLRLGGAESKVGQMILAALGIGVLLTIMIIAFFKEKHSGGRIEFQGVMQADLAFGPETGYHDIVRKLGQPESDRWLSEEGERQFRLLSYPKQDLHVILMGAERDKIHYIGSKNNEWRNVHSVKLPGAVNTDAILRAIPRPK